MVAKNNITGDLIQSKLNSKAFEDNFDRIFRKVKEEAPELWTEEDEKRVDIIGQNGPVGYSIEEMYAEGEKDYGA